MINSKNFMVNAFQVAGVLLIFSVFLVILNKYYGHDDPQIRENPRFAEINYQLLQLEAANLSISPATARPAENVFVLTYHDITRNTTSSAYDITFDQFKETMFALKEQGYQTVSLDDFYLFLRGEKTLPDKSFILTFDDGAKSAFYNADPILEVLNYTAVMFVITGQSLTSKQSPYYLNESELHDMLLTGRWELESHGAGSHNRAVIGPNGETDPALTNKIWHADENRLETDDEYFTRVSADIYGAKDLLESRFNISVIGFALPFGDFGERRNNYPDAHNILYNLTTSVHDMIFYQFKPSRNKDFRANYIEPDKESYLIVRLSADTLRTPDDLLKEIEASRVIDLPYTENYSNDDKWPRISGEGSFEKDMIVLKNGSIDDVNSVVSMTAYLDGSYLWTDYNYSLQLKNSGASIVILFSRFKSSVDYVACRYGGGIIRITAVNDGIAQNYAEKMVTNETLQNGTILSMSVSGSNVSCSYEGKEVISSVIQGMPKNGGVGVKAEGFYNEDKNFAFGNISIIGRE